MSREDQPSAGGFAQAFGTRRGTDALPFDTRFAEREAPAAQEAFRVGREFLGNHFQVRLGEGPQPDAGLLFDYRDPPVAAPASFRPRITFLTAIDDGMLPPSDPRDILAGADRRLLALRYTDEEFGDRAFRVTPLPVTVMGVNLPDQAMHPVFLAYQPLRGALADAGVATREQLLDALLGLLTPAAIDLLWVLEPEPTVTKARWKETYGAEDYSEIWDMLVRLGLIAGPGITDDGLWLRDPPQPAAGT